MPFLTHFLDLYRSGKTIHPPNSRGTSQQDTDCSLVCSDVFPLSANISANQIEIEMVNPHLKILNKFIIVYLHKLYLYFLFKVRMLLYIQPK